MRATRMAVPGATIALTSAPRCQIVSPAGVRAISRKPGRGAPKSPPPGAAAPTLPAASRAVTRRSNFPPPRGGSSARNVTAGAGPTDTVPRSVSGSSAPSVTICHATAVTARSSVARPTRATVLSEVRSTSYSTRGAAVSAGVAGSTGRGWS